MNIHQLIKEKCELAQTYAENGAFYMAAARLRELADIITAHAAGNDFIRLIKDAEKREIVTLKTTYEMAQERAEAHKTKMQSKRQPVTQPDDDPNMRMRPDGTRFKPGN